MASTSTPRVSSEDRREQILDVAMSLFARQGFEGTTTRQLAETARVNEAIIFRHFPSKEDLYWAIIERKCQTSGRRAMLEEMLASGGSDLEVFSGIAERILRRTKRDAEITRLLLFTALERHELSDEFFRKHVAGQFELLAGYIRRRIDQGVFRRVEPVLAARSFLGMVIYFYLVEELFAGSRRSGYDPASVGRWMTELWLSGMTAKSGSRIGNGHAAASPVQKVRQNGKRATRNGQARDKRRAKVPKVLA
jgi:AcrR family transcriptional regulator